MFLVLLRLSSCSAHLKLPLRLATVSRALKARVHLPLPPQHPEPQPSSGTFSYGNTRLSSFTSLYAWANQRPLRNPIQELGPLVRVDSVSRVNHFPRNVVTMGSIKGHADPLPIRTASPAPLAQDFARQAVHKQQRSNFHSSSIASGVSRIMVSQSVNKTALHPTGVQ